MLQVISSEVFRTKDIQTRSKAFSAISRLSRGCQYLPRSYWIDEGTISLPKEPHTSGTCAEVYKGMRNGISVAIKVLRTSKLENQSKLRKVSTGSTTRGHQLTRLRIALL